MLYKVIRIKQSETYLDNGVLATATLPHFPEDPNDFIEKINSVFDKTFFATICTLPAPGDDLFILEYEFNEDTKVFTYRTCVGVVKFYGDKIGEYRHQSPAEQLFCDRYAMIKAGLIGEMNKRNIDQNEFGKNNQREKEIRKEKKERVRLGHLILEFGTGGIVTEESIDMLFEEIRAVDVVTLKGFILNIPKAIKYVSDKMKAHDVECFRLDVSVTI